MLLFADGFENFDITDLDKKWDSFVYSAQEAGIVKNNDRKGERVLELLETTNFTLTKKIKKSRTVFLGFALKYVAGTNDQYLKVSFSQDDMLNARVWCDFLINASSVTFHWTIGSTYATNTIDHYSVIDITSSTGFLYLEFGVTLNGNATNDEDCTSWVENRVGTGQQAEKITTRTFLPTGDGIATYETNWFDTVAIAKTSSYQSYLSAWLDDVYICNDESSFNNTFLGDVRIRPMTPSFYGSINNAEMVNFEGFRHEGVAADFVNTVDPLPDPLPDPEQNPDFIPWTDPTTQYLRLNKEEQTQLFRMTHPNYGGAQPNIIGVIGTVVCRANTDIGKQAKLQLARRISLDPVEMSGKDALLNPIKTGDWQGYSLIMENEEEQFPGIASQKWKTTDVDESDWGFRLLENDTDPKEYLPGHLRLQLNHEEILYEYLLTQDFTHRFWDRLADEILNMTSWSVSGWAQFAYETIGLEDMETVVRRGLKGINEQLYIKDEIPWQYIFIKEILQIDDPLFFTWGGDVFESLEFGTSAYHEFVEMVTSQVDLFSSQTKTDIGEVVREVMGLEEPLVWDNHESLEENINMIVSYVWTNHEVIEEWITHAVMTKMGFGQDVVSSLNLIEEHFDGWWVEELTDRALPWEDQITQHWRYEWFMGVLINSIKMTPIEDTGQWGGDGNDGDHTGLIDWN